MFEGYKYVEKSGKPVKKRIENPDTIRTIFGKLTDDDRPDADRRTKIRKLYDGALPYNPNDLAAKGLKNISNVNFLGLKGVIDNRADSILKLSQDTAPLIELRPIAREAAGPRVASVGRIVAEEWSTMVRSSGRLIPAIARMHKEADLYGLGPIAWPSSLDYNPIALDRGQLRFVSNGSVISSAHELFMFESELTAEYLCFLLDNEELARAEGWNIPEVKKWLVAVYHNGADTKYEGGFDGNSTALEEAVAMVRRNSLGEEQQFKTFSVIHTYVRETAMPRGITHIIVPSTGPSKFLFEKQNAYRTMDECVLWLPYSIKDKYAREVRGLASFLYPIEKLNNRLLNHIVDAGFRASTLVIQAQAGQAPSQQLTVNEQGLYTVLPAGVSPTNQQFSPNFQQIVGVKQLLDQVGVGSVAGTDKGSVATTGPKLFQGPSSGPTKAEVEIQQRQKSRRDEAEFCAKQDVLNKIFKESFRRSLAIAFLPSVTRMDFPEIDEWLNRCALRGVSQEELMMVPSLYTIVASRDLALGADGKVKELDDFMALFGGTIDESGRRYIAREHAVLRFGQAEADNIIPEIHRDRAPTDQASFATIENGCMKAGIPVMVGADQLHWSHIPIHTQVIQEIVQQVQAPEDNEGSAAASQAGSAQSAANPADHIEDPRGMLSLLQTVSNHIQEHLQIGGMQPGMEGKAKQVSDMLKGLRPTIKALNLAIQTQERVEQAEREKQQRELEELQKQASEVEMQKARYKVDRDAEVAKYRVDRENEVAMRRLDLEGSRAGIQANIDERKAIANETRRDRETDSRIRGQERIAEARERAAANYRTSEAASEIMGNQSVSPDEIIANPVDDELSAMSL